SLTIHPAKSAERNSNPAAIRLPPTRCFAGGAGSGASLGDLTLAITDLPLFSMLRTRMHWHQERQRLLSENVANSDTPSYRPRDLAPLQFDRVTPALASIGLD